MLISKPHCAAHSRTSVRPPHWTALPQPPFLPRAHTILATRKPLLVALRFRLHDTAAEGEAGADAPDDRRPAPVGDLLASSEVQEILRTAHVVLTQAERRLGGYCSTFTRVPRGPGPEGTTAAALGGAPGASNSGAGSGGQEPDAGSTSVLTAAGGRCWHVYRSLREARRRLEAAAGAEAVTTGHAGPACAEVEVLERLVRELSYAPVEDMCRVLAANERLLGSLVPEQHDPQQQHRQQRHADAGEEGTGGGGGTGGGCSLTVVDGLERAHAERVFAALDHNGRGWLDREDLTGGLELMGQHLDPSDVEQLCLELGAYGRVDLQTFCDVVEAQRLQVPGSDAVFLRHLRHDRPEWWTEAPGFVENSP